MSFQLNQFKLTDHAGEKMNPSGLVIEGRISSDEASYYEAGQVVKFDTAEAGDSPVVEKISDTEGGIGVILFNMKKSKRYANEMIEVAMKGSIVTMVAGSAIARGADVAFHPSTGYVTTTTGAKIGSTIDIASAAGDIVRVFVDPSES